tara:strand:+ start:28 stop:366 length:339 start_codon:yes stop_codon:yes gene_type:complete
MRVVASLRWRSDIAASEMPILKGIMGALFANLDCGIGFSLKEGVVLFNIARLDVSRSGLAVATDPNAMAMIAVSRAPKIIATQKNPVRSRGCVDSFECIAYPAAEAGSGFLF